jgi:hypothetical protein
VGLFYLLLFFPLPSPDVLLPLLLLGEFAVPLLNLQFISQSVQLLPDSKNQDHPQQECNDIVTASSNQCTHLSNHTLSQVHILCDAEAGMQMRTVRKRVM